MDRNEKKNTFKNVQDKRKSELQKEQRKSRIIGKVISFILLTVIIGILAFYNIKQFHEREELQIRIDILSAELQENKQSEHETTENQKTESDAKTIESEGKLAEPKIQTTESEMKSAETETEIKEKTELQKIIENSQIQSAVIGIGKNAGVEVANIEDTKSEMQVGDIAKMYLVAMIYDGLNRSENTIQIEWKEEERVKVEDSNNIERSYLQAVLNRGKKGDLSSDDAADILITKFKEKNYTTDQFCNDANLEKTKFVQFTENKDAITSVSDCIEFMKQIAAGKVANFAENASLGEGDPFVKMKELFMEDTSDGIYPSEITVLKNEKPIWCSESFSDQDKGECRRTVILIQQGEDGYIVYFEYKKEQGEEAGKLSNEIWSCMNSISNGESQL